MCKSKQINLPEWMNSQEAEEWEQTLEQEMAQDMELVLKTYELELEHNKVLELGEEQVLDCHLNTKEIKITIQNNQKYTF